MVTDTASGLPIWFAEALALGVALLVMLGEALHASRTARVGRLAFGPSGKPAVWARSATVLRTIAAAALVWGLATLRMIPPRVHVAETIPDNQKRNLILIIDVSPSMRLKDAGQERKQTRAQRVAELMGSFFQRVPMEQYLVSLIATYNGSKPVVVGTKDMEVIRNVLNVLPMQYAFNAGKTDLFSGLEEAAKIAQPWRPKSTLVVMLSDGDTVPATGIPKMPAAVSDLLIVGVGDSRAWTFIEGRQSRQDASMLRQIATRLNGTYHDGNEKHLPTDLLQRLTLVPRGSPWVQLTRREYALILCALGASILAFLPVLLHHAGTSWQPGIAKRPEKRSKAPRETASRV